MTAKVLLRCEFLFPYLKRATFYNNAYKTARKQLKSNYSTFKSKRRTNG